MTPARRTYLETTVRKNAIDLAERLAGTDHGERVLRGQYSVLEQHRTLVGPNGETLRPASARRREHDEHAAQAFIAAYRSATEF